MLIFQVKVEVVKRPGREAGAGRARNRVVLNLDDAREG